jgi:nicotinamidase-related amidase
MNNRLLESQEVCLQIIDVQASLMAKIIDSEKIASNIALLINCAKILDLPIIANTQYIKGLGPYVDVVEELVRDIQHIDKVEFNAVENPATAEILSTFSATKSTVVLVGVETHICVYQTAIGLLNKGFNVWVVDDAVSSRTIASHQSGINRLRSLGITIGCAEMLIYELLGKAGSPEFKKILPLIIDNDKKLM